MKQLLVPVQFEDASGKLVSYAGSLAKAIGAELVLLHNTGTTTLTFTQQSRAIQALRTFADHHLNKYNQSCFKQFECLVKPGMLHESIKSVVQDYAVDMVLMHTLPVVEQVQADQNQAAAIMQLLDVPLMVLPEGKDYQELKRLIFATDFTDRDPKVLQRILAFATQVKAKLTLVQVYTLADDPQLSIMNQAMREVEALLNSKNVSVRLLEEEDVLEGISDFAEREGADMLLMATQDSYLMQRLFSNTYLKTKAYHTQIPLLTYRQVKRKPCSGCCANCKSKTKQQVASGLVTLDDTKV